MELQASYTEVCHKLTEKLVIAQTLAKTQKRANSRRISYFYVPLVVASGWSK
jgi:hypothetical protein